MNPSRKHPTILPALIMALLVSACSDDFGTQPEGLLGPEIQPVMAKAAKGGNSDEEDTEKTDKKEKKGPKVKAKTKSGEEAEYRLGVAKRTTDKSPSTVWVNGSSGETLLQVGGHTLTIPAGLVQEPTLFSIKLEQRQYQNDEVVLAVQLHATRTEGRGKNARTIDVGSQGFDGKTLRLCLSYEGMLDVEADDLTGAAILWLQANGETNEAFDPEPDSPAGSLCVDRDHFSDYGLGWPTRNTF